MQERAFYHTQTERARVYMDHVESLLNGNIRGFIQSENFQFSQVDPRQIRVREEEVINYWRRAYAWMGLPGIQGTLESSGIGLEFPVLSD